MGVVLRGILAALAALGPLDGLRQISSVAAEPRTVDLCGGQKAQGGAATTPTTEQRRRKGGEAEFRCTVACQEQQQPKP